jgi:phage shock protein PspC (stress-responsive transcriptional regulator)
MNKTISINLGGSVFNIEEEAYIILRNYLEKISANFSDDPATSEIMSDIETRIAEIFHEKNSDRKNVVTRDDVDEMMLTMGRPEDYKMDDDGGKTAGQDFYQAPRNHRRKIYRDTDDAVIAGVCSGLSHYLGWDPLVLRLLIAFLTIVSFGFPGVLGYIIFWALVPAARSTGEKLQMRGETVNVENIGRFVNHETKAAADRVNKFGKTAAQNIRTGSGDFFRGLGRVFSVIFGLFILMMGLGLLGSLFSLLIFSEFNAFGIEGNNWEALNTVVFGNDGTLWVLVIGIILLLAAPAIALIYAAVKLITGSTKRIKGFALSLLSLFIIGVLMSAYGGVKTGKQFSRHAEETSTSLLPISNSDTLHFDVIPDSVFIGRTSRHHDFTDLIKIETDKIYYGEPVDVHFEPTHSTQYKVQVIRSSQGQFMEQAGMFARDIDYNSIITSDSIQLAAFFTTPRSDAYRGQNVEVKVFVPIGKYVEFGENSNWITWHHEDDGPLRMSEDGLETLEEQREREEDELEQNVDIDIDEPHLKVTDDSVVIRSGNVEIKTKRD